MYSEISKTLQQAYDKKVSERDAPDVEPWKSGERQSFLDRLKAENKENMLEVGAGTGRHGAWFQEAGLKVVSTDLSAEMVEACRQKGLDAYQMDFLSLDFEEATFDAVFALNCLLHVPRTDMPEVLTNLGRLLRPDGLLYWGQYGGDNYEGSFEWDNYEPKRFFATLTDEDMQSLGSSEFELLDFHIVNVNRNDEHFQSSTWRKRSPS